MRDPGLDGAEKRLKRARTELENAGIDDARIVRLDRWNLLAASGVVVATLDIVLFGGAVAWVAWGTAQACWLGTVIAATRVRCARRRRRLEQSGSNYDIARRRRNG